MLGTHQPGLETLGRTRPFRDHWCGPKVWRARHSLGIFVVAGLWTFLRTLLQEENLRSSLGIAVIVFSLEVLSPQEMERNRMAVSSLPSALLKE